MMLEEYPDILTVEEACEALRVGYNAMYELLNSGKVKAYRNGRVWRIPKASLVEFIRNSVVQMSK
jgi:excisionase family DNA binding protein